MNINDKSVLEILNTHIAINRLNKNQILLMVNLLSISNDINDLINIVDVIIITSMISKSPTVIPLSLIFIIKHIFF